MMRQKRFSDVLGLRLSRQALRVLKERGIFAHSPVSLEHQHLAKTLCGAGVGVRRRGRRTWAIRDVHHRRWPANRVAPSGGGHRSERLTCRRGGAGTGASRNVAQGTDVRTADYAASIGRAQLVRISRRGFEDVVSEERRSPPGRSRSRQECRPPKGTSRQVDRECDADISPQSGCWCRRRSVDGFILL